MLKLTSRKTLPLNDLLHVPNIRENLVSIALLGKVGVKVSFESERKNMTLKEIMNSLLVSALALDNLWSEAILSACHLQNIISYKKTGRTPYELWKGHAPNLKYLKVWGCLAKVMLHYHKKRKIGSKTSYCMFIGYASNSETYRFLVFEK